MKKLTLSVEDLAVETFDAGASPDGRTGTVAAMADTGRCWTINAETECPPSDIPCTTPSAGPTVAMCAPTTFGMEGCDTDIHVCPAETSPDTGC